ncbi:hypothetical protein MLD52_16515 [Puniceicoccaceae bacterium K14]|nr:hypothetical protein [Puniceicoccaceae bacterium K14]
MKKTYNLKPHARILFAAFTLILFGSTSRALAENETLFMIEVLDLKEDASIEKAWNYFDTIQAITASHGFFPIDSYRVKSSKPESDTKRMIAVWKIEDKSKFSDLMNDPLYKVNIPTRDSIFNLETRQMWFSTRRP